MSRPHNGLAREARPKTLRTGQEIRRDIKGGVLGQFRGPRM